MPAVQNAELHAKSESLDLTPQVSADTFSSLDSIMAEEAKKSGATDADIAEATTSKPAPAPAPNIHDTTGLDDAATKVEADQKAAADKAVTDKAVADKAAADALAAADPAKAAADKVAADKAAADKAAAEKKDELDKIELPAHSSPKAVDSFNALKKSARETQATLQTQLSERDTKLAEATAELEKLRKVSGNVPEDVTKELEDLRKFRVAHDVESDPSFAKFKGEIAANREAIYSKLKQVGYTDENIARIKELGGPESVLWDKKDANGESLLERLPIHTRLFLQAKLVDNVNIADRRDAALEAAKADGQKFLSQRAEKDSGELLNTANGHLKSLSWTAERPIPATATPEQKAEIEAGNKEAKEAMDTVKMYLSDRSPSRHAELAIGTLLAHRFERQLAAATTKLASVETAHKAALELITKERDVLKADLDAVKRAEIPRTEQSLTTITPAPKKGAFDNRSGSEALEALAAETVANANH